MANRIQLRRDTAANFASANPTLAQGEPAFETDTGKEKLGDGINAWNNLPYKLGALSKGGTTNQVATKQSNQDGDIIWSDALSDMLKSDYDPRNINADAFDMENMTESVGKKIFTADERIKLNSLDQVITLKGNWNPSSGFFPSNTVAGWSYLIEASGTVDNIEFNVGDRLISLTDNASTTVYAGNWFKDDGSDKGMKAEIEAANTKTTPTDSDLIGILDSAASFVLRKLSWANLKTTLKTYFDNLYQGILVSGTNIKTLNNESVLGSGNINIDPTTSWNEITGDQSTVNLIGFTDGEAGGLEFNEGGLASVSAGFSFFSSFAINPNNGNILGVTSTPPSVTRVVRSTDFGNTWEVVFPTGVITVAQGRVVRWLNDRFYILTGTNSPILETTDFGETIVDASGNGTIPPAAGFDDAIYYPPTGEYFFIKTLDCYRTSDFITFASSNTGSISTGIATNGTDTIVVVGRGGDIVTYSTDGGLTWTAASPPSGTAYGVVYNPDNDTWGVALSDGGNLKIAVYSGDLSSFILTSNSGGAVSATESKQIAYYNGAFYAYAASVLYSTTDGTTLVSLENTGVPATNDSINIYGTNNGVFLVTGQFSNAGSFNDWRYSLSIERRFENKVNEYRDSDGNLITPVNKVLTLPASATPAQGALATTAVQPNTAPVLDATNFTNLPSNGAVLEQEVPQTNHGLLVGDWVRMDGNNFVKALADTAENAPVVGYVKTVTNANTFTYQHGGLAPIAGLTVGGSYFLQDDGSIGITEGTINLFVGTATPQGLLIEIGQGFEKNNNNDSGNPILYGSGAPASGLGNDGDTYIDTDNDVMYGPKTTGAWGNARGIITFFQRDDNGFRTKDDVTTSNARYGYGGPSQVSTARVHAFYGPNGDFICMTGRNLYAFKANGAKDNLDFRCLAAYFEGDMILNGNGTFKTNDETPLNFGDPINLYSATTVAKNAIVGIQEGSVLRDQTLQKIQLFENAAWRNIIQKSQDIDGDVISPTILSGAYTYETALSRMFLLTMTENTLFTVPTIDNGKTYDFTVILTGNFTPNYDANTEVTADSDAYDGTIRNELYYRCYNASGISQVNILTIRNLI